jgi:alpha-L-rhamnosidase
VKSSNNYESDPPFPAIVADPMNPLKLIRPIVALLPLALLSGFAGVRVKNLRCEYRENPLGIDEVAPRLGWQLAADARGERQTAYHVLVASSAERLRKDDGDLWDSGRVESDESLHVAYAGQRLAARQAAYWKVEVWDQQGAVSGWSPVATWELGLPNPKDWTGAAWVRLAKDTRTSALSARPFQTSEMEQPIMKQPPASALLRREFAVKSGVVRARAYVCGLGYNEVYINGDRCGDAVLDPGQTTYDIHAYYVTHDITAHLRAGRNAIGVMLGNGFYGQMIAFRGQLGYGDPGLIAKVVIDYANGSQQVIATDETWRATTGPIVFDNVYAGETYDARLERKGWSSPGFDDSDWLPADRQAKPLAPVLQAQMISPIRQIETIKPVAQWTDSQGDMVYDLGVNIAGWARLHVREPAGTEISVRFAEVLMPNHKDIDPAGTGGFATGFDQIDQYVCAGTGMEEWQPRFTYHGGRYLEVRGLSHPTLDSLEGVVVRTDVSRAGSFTCSDEFLNQLYQISLRTIEGNLHSVPEDCPHREKCAWLGDAVAVGETEMFNFDLAQFFTKFMADVETVCGPARGTYQGTPGTPGLPSNIAVGRRLPQQARPDWGDAVVLVPWYLYVYYGDTRVMADHYPLMKRWLAHVSSLAKDQIVYQGYGDWCPPGSRDDPRSNPVEITSTAMHYGCLRRAAEMAQVLGKGDDARQFDAEADLVRSAFNAKFLDRATMLYGSQTSNAVALRFGLPETVDAPRVAASLARRIRTLDHGHPTTGIHGSRPIYTMLDDYGQSDAAFALMTVAGYPGYHYLLDWGFTTWPERYVDFNPADRLPDRSYNHPMQSGFAAWFHESVAGIRPDPGAPGFLHIEMEPHQFRQLAWVKATHEAPTGTIRSEWTSRDGEFAWKITVPPGSTATAYVPARDVASVREGGGAAPASPGIKFLRFDQGRAIFAVKSGTYRFESRL